MIKFKRNEIPVSYSLIGAARHIKKVARERHPFRIYFYYWAAFNEIYSTISYTASRSNTLRMDATGQPFRRQNGSVQIPIVQRVQEREQIDLAFDEFDDELKHNLIVHPNTVFFLNRIPKWQGQQIEFDSIGQKLNGVLKVSDTINIDYPVWSPIDIPAYQAYSANPTDSVSRDLLSKQILNLLYTVRCNLAHGHKEYNDGNDVTVVQNALPLLKTIISAFTY